MKHIGITIENGHPAGIDKPTTDNLVSLLTISRSSAESYSEAVGGVSDKTGIRKPVIRAYVKALYDSERDQVAADAEQLQELLKKASQ